MGNKIYDLQFNNDEESAMVFLLLLQNGWTLKTTREAEGFTWFQMELYEAYTPLSQQTKK